MRLYSTSPNDGINGTPQARISLSIEILRNNCNARFILLARLSDAFPNGAAPYKKSSLTKSNPHTSYT